MHGSIREKMKAMFPEFLRKMKIREMKYTHVNVSTRFILPFLRKLTKAPLRISKKDKYLVVLNVYDRPSIVVPSNREIHSLIWNLFHERAHIKDKRKEVDLPAEVKEFFAEMRALESVVRRFGRASFPFVHSRVFYENKTEIHDAGVLKGMLLLMAGSDPERVFRKITKNLEKHRIKIANGCLRIYSGEKDVTYDFLKNAGLSGREIKILTKPEP